MKDLKKLTLELMVSRSSYALARVSSRASRLVGRPRVRVLDAFVRSRSRGTRARRCDGACSLWIDAILSTLTRRCATVRVPFGSMDGSVTIVARRRRCGSARCIYIYAWRARACVSIYMRDARATPRAPLNQSIDRSIHRINRSVSQSHKNCTFRRVTDDDDDDDDDASHGTV